MISLTSAILLRFVFGGLAVVASTIVARLIGGKVGGIFAAFPAVYLAAVVGAIWHVSGDQAITVVQSISKGALIGMISDIICAVAASYFILKHGHWKGVLLSLGIWLGTSSIIYFSLMV